MVNRASGKGYENEDFYTNIKFKFIGIENIHVMRNSLQKLLEGEKGFQYILYFNRSINRMTLIKTFYRIILSDVSASL